MEKGRTRPAQGGTKSLIMQPGLPLRVPEALTEGCDRATATDPHWDTGVTSMHVAPLSGWGSDPHGPLFWKGRYHLFYQGRPGTCNWYWGLRWDHCVSNDLVRWVRLPPAILPTPGGLDADGCFTGNIQVHPKTGVPMMFYTGARLRHNPTLQNPPPPDGSWNPFMLHWETQLCAVADPDDELLVKWTKVATPWMELPHCAYLTAWRDPFFIPPEVHPDTGKPLYLHGKETNENGVVESQTEVDGLVSEDSNDKAKKAKLWSGTFPAVTQPVKPKKDTKDRSSSADKVADSNGVEQSNGPAVSGNGHAAVNGTNGVHEDGRSDREHMMIIGSGLEGLGGTALIYRSQDLASGWRFEGYLCTWPNLETGICWECPHLLHLPDLPQGLTCCTHTMSPEWKKKASLPSNEDEKQLELIKLAEAAWESVGMDPREAWKTIDITAISEDTQPEDSNADATSQAATEGQEGWRTLASHAQSMALANNEAQPQTPPFSQLMLEVLEGVLADAAGAIAPTAGDVDSIATPDAQADDSASSDNLPNSEQSSVSARDIVCPLPTHQSTNLSRRQSGLQHRLSTGLAAAPAGPPGSTSSSATALQAQLSSQISHTLLGSDRAPAPGAGLLSFAVAVSRQGSMSDADQMLADALSDVALQRSRTAGVVAAAAAAVSNADITFDLNPQADSAGDKMVTAAMTSGEAAQDALVQAIMAGREQGAAATVAAAANVVTVSQALASFPSLKIQDLGEQSQTNMSAIDSDDESLPDGARRELTMMSAFASDAAQVSMADPVTPTNVTSPSDFNLRPGTSMLASGSRQQSMYDIKTTGEAGLAGLGYVGVLSHHAPHDIAATRPAEEQSSIAPAGSAPLQGDPQPPSAPGNQGIFRQQSGKGYTLPWSPYLPPGIATREDVRAACRRYAEAAAAVQGYDLGLPSDNARCVRQCKEGPPDVPERAADDQRWFLGIAPDAATYSIVYFLGNYTHNRFDLENSHGPFKLDIGNVLYAPLAFYDQKEGRHLMWGYLKELWSIPPPPSMCNKYSHSGCVSLPRALYFKEGRLHQVPIPELSRLRTGKSWKQDKLQLTSDQPLQLPADVATDKFDFEVTVKRGNSRGLVISLPSWRKDNRGAAAIVFDWATLRLEVKFDDRSADYMPAEEHGDMPDVSGLHRVPYPAPTDGSDACGETVEPNGEALDGHANAGGDKDASYTIFFDTQVPPVKDMNPDVQDWIRMKKTEAGGRLWMEADDSLSLRIFVDSSAVEIFTGTGQALSTRIYRGIPDGLTPTTLDGEACKDSGLKLAAAGGTCTLEHIECYATDCAWLRHEDVPLPRPVTTEALKLWAEAARAGGPEPPVEVK